MKVLVTLWRVPEALSEVWEGSSAETVGEIPEAPVHRVGEVPQGSVADTSQGCVQIRCRYWGQVPEGSGGESICAEGSGERRERTCGSSGGGDTSVRFRHVPMLRRFHGRCGGWVPEGSRVPAQISRWRSRRFRCRYWEFSGPATIPKKSIKILKIEKLPTVADNAWIYFESSFMAGVGTRHVGGSGIRESYLWQSMEIDNWMDSTPQIVCVCSIHVQSAHWPCVPTDIHKWDGKKTSLIFGHTRRTYTIVNVI